MSVISECFLMVRPGDFVCINESFNECSDNNQYWIGKILYVVSGARNPSSNSIFQVINIDTGTAKYVNANFVIAILKPFIETDRWVITLNEKIAWVKKYLRIKI